SKSVSCSPWSTARSARKPTGTQRTCRASNTVAMADSSLARRSGGTIAFAAVGGEEVEAAQLVLPPELDRVMAIEPGHLEFALLGHAIGPDVVDQPGPHIIERPILGRPLSRGPVFILGQSVLLPDFRGASVDALEGRIRIECRADERIAQQSE